jgi:hypothetical protein
MIMKVTEDMNGNEIWKIKAESGTRLTIKNELMNTGGFS